LVRFSTHGGATDGHSVGFYSTLLARSFKPGFRSIWDWGKRAGEVRLFESSSAMGAIEQRGTRDFLRYWPRTVVARPARYLSDQRRFRIRKVIGRGKGVPCAYGVGGRAGVVAQPVFGGHMKPVAFGQGRLHQTRAITGAGSRTERGPYGNGFAASLGANDAQGVLSRR